MYFAYVIHQVPLTIPGLDIGVSMMSLGEIASLLIPPGLNHRGMCLVWD
jgi:FKBP-type peptidyl-prolyl cis-trans isomerase